ncbi:MAG: D-aminoacylase [Candidatus Marinimicrobia bacterium]|jgi:N-acyl-D-amino-acid deacylase|nr:D-aminoacylase [Candidatus Neomarinimicrobiota bacterium]MDP6594193.1 D-aminoacylase [Candidatus Neomarinimicrobiota bacterium]MDP6837034.1 D-aminoacylase [Candidatus Neomarinimicrobiota bacterium]|tara:strand:+ start:1651 stop:3351 length:1701 start_codon:yes stop_codon:yes gene_type:complete
MKHLSIFSFAAVLFWSCQPPAAITPDSPISYDVIIRNGTVYDGSGAEGIIADVAISGDRIAKIGPNLSGKAKAEIDATNMAVTPGFINMLSWATESLIADGKSQSDIRQGVTLEVFGEGWSMGPLSETMKKEEAESQGDLKYDIAWTTLGEYLEFLERRGIASNVASFVGATTLRIHQIGFEDRPPSEEEMAVMKDLVRQAMEEGALGVGSSLIYAPAFYSSTEELIELCKVASEYGGMYISHMRSESNRLLEALDELIRIASEADIPAEVYHLKAGGKKNHYKMDLAIAKMDSARAAGLKITADMYTYTAGATGLDASMPPWVQEGGYEKWAERLKSPAIWERVKAEMQQDTDDWENLGLLAGYDNVLFGGFKNPDLREYIGKTLVEVAQMRGTPPEDTAMDLVIEDGSRVDVVYFLMSEENVKKQIRVPYVSFDSDAGSLAPESDFLKSNPHPRAYGNFARLLGKYVRDEKVIPLHEAIYRLSGLPATNLKIRQRGFLKEGYYADVVVFDPNSIQDHATFENPHQYSTGVHHVFVNGGHVLNDGEHTGITPGRVVRGPGWVRWN